MIDDDKLELKPHWRMSWAFCCDLLAYTVAIGVPWVIGMWWLIGAVLARLQE